MAQLQEQEMREIAELKKELSARANRSLRTGIRIPEENAFGYFNFIRKQIFVKNIPGLKFCQGHGCGYFLTPMLESFHGRVAKW